MKKLMVQLFLTLSFCSYQYAGAESGKPMSMGKGFRVAQFVDASRYPGINVNDTLSDQAAINALMHDSSIHAITFPAGRYTAPSGIDNYISDRIFNFEPGAIIVGTFHVAAGSGLDSLVKNVVMTGNPTITDRLGMYLCQDVTIEAATILNPDLGTRGVHIYWGSHDINIGRLYIGKTTRSSYALGIDDGAGGYAFEPSNINIDEVIVESSDSSGIRIASTRNCRIKKAVIHAFNRMDGFYAYNNNNLMVDRLDINGRSLTVPRAGTSGLRIELDTGGVFFSGAIDADSATMSGISVVSCYGGTRFGYFENTSSDTVGSKFGVQIVGSKFVSFLYMRSVRFAQGLRVVNDSHVVIDQFQLDSCRQGFVGGGTNFNFRFVMQGWSDNTDSSNGVMPSDIATAVPEEEPCYEDNLPMYLGLRNINRVIDNVHAWAYTSTALELSGITLMTYRRTDSTIRPSITLWSDGNISLNGSNDTRHSNRMKRDFPFSNSVAGNIWTSILNHINCTPVDTQQEVGLLVQYLYGQKDAELSSDSLKLHVPSATTFLELVQLVNTLFQSNPIPQELDLSN